MTGTHVKFHAYGNSKRDLLLLLSPADRSTTMLVAFPFVILYIPLGLIDARVAKVGLGITDAIAAGTARTAAKISVNFMMIKQLGRETRYKGSIVCRRGGRGNPL